MSLVPHRHAAAVALATEDGGNDTARRACVDLLKLELKRANIDLPTSSQDEEISLRDLIYGDDNSATGNSDSPDRVVESKPQEKR